MSELEIILKEIEKNKREGEHQLTVQWKVNPETILDLRQQGYLVLQVFTNGYIDTIVGWKKND